MMRQEWSGVIVDGPYAGERRTNRAPSMMLLQPMRIEGARLYEQPSEPVLIKDLLYLHGEMIHFEADTRRVYGFWYDPELAKDAPSPVAHFLLRLMDGFRPIVEDARIRYDRARDEVAAASKAMRPVNPPTFAKPWWPEKGHS